MVPSLLLMTPVGTPLDVPPVAVNIHLFPFLDDSLKGDDMELTDHPYYEEQYATEAVRSAFQQIEEFRVRVVELEAAVKEVALLYGPLFNAVTAVAKQYGPRR
jgi:hypothetical protein